MKKWMSVSAAILCLPAFLAWRAQDEKKTAWEPGKEHQLLKQFDGDWEFKSRCTMPGQEVQEGQGTETSRFTHGGFWLECETKGTMAKGGMKGKDFTGEGYTGYDPEKKKFVGVWIDNQSPFLGRFEGD